MSDNGSEALDFTYIEDLVDEIVKCIGNKKAFNEVFNLTYGSACSVSDMANKLKIIFLMLIYAMSIVIN